MEAAADFDWHASAASALDWWRDAGVDTLVDDAPVNWLAPPAAPVPATVIPVSGVAVPDSLEAFALWRAGPDAPDAAWSGRRITAEGDVRAPFWVFTDLPERDDLAAGTLFSGAQGRLLARMLAAVGLDRGAVHLVPLGMARPPVGRIGADAEKTLGAAARHYLQLARPLRVLLLGEAASRCVLGIGCRDARGTEHPVNHTVGQAGAKTLAVASLHPRMLLDRPTAKADAWRDLRLWKGSGT